MSWTEVTVISCDLVLSRPPGGWKGTMPLSLAFCQLTWARAGMGGPAGAWTRCRCLTWTSVPDRHARHPGFTPCPCLCELRLGVVVQAQPGMFPPLHMLPHLTKLLLCTMVSESCCPLGLLFGQLCGGIF